MAYPNRTDLQNPAQKVAKRVARSPQYGQGAAQMRAQEAVPMAASQGDVQAAQAARQGPAPGSLGDFARPTERPDEPITAGANFGPGPNAVQAGVQMAVRSEDPVLDRLREIYRAYPNDDLADLLDSYIRDGY